MPPSRQSKDKRRATEERILEAQKTIMCSMLHDQQKKHGMAYAIVVWNGPDDVFVRVRSDTTQQAIEMELAVDLVKDSLVDSTKDNPVVHLERSKIRNEG